MLKSIWQRWTILIIIVAIALSSCRQLINSTSAETNNRLVFTIGSDPKTFNSALSNSLPRIFDYVDEGLVTDNDKGEIEPALAESWQASPDGRSITFKLRKNLKWSDGAPLTVDDVLFTFNDIYLSKTIQTDTQDALRIGKDRKLPTVKKIDAERVEFTAPETFAPFLRSLAVGILPAHKLAKTVTQKDSEGKPEFLSTWGINTNPKDLVACGMFVLDSYTPGERLVFKRNPHYWRKDARGNQQPYVERVVWQIVESPDTSLVQFRSGDLDAFGVSPSFFSLIKKGEQQGRYKVYNGGPSSSTTFIFFNLNRGERNDKPLVDPVKSRWFNNVKFRQAVAYALDRQRMITNIYRGLGAPQDSPISVSSPYYLSREQGLPFYDYNPKKAKELLLEAGFKYDERDRAIDEDGNPARFTLLVGAGGKSGEAVGTQIKQDLGAIGVEVDFTPVAWNLIVDKLDNSLDWDAIIMSFTGGIEPNDGANLWSVNGASHVFNLNPQQGNRITNHQVADWEKKIDELYIQAAQELDENKRRQLYVESQIVTQQNLPFIYLVNPLIFSAIKDRIQGINYSPSNGVKGAFWNLYELKVTSN
jgi:peptide/nickel transport system substrate-binding protein